MEAGRTSYRAFLPLATLLPIDAPRALTVHVSGRQLDPPLQGSGIGTELMRSRLARCDAAGMPAYLESSKERNVPFYERHGFTVTRELKIPDGGPLLWLMWRDPRPGGVPE